MKGTTGKRIPLRVKRLTPLVELTELRVNKGWTPADLAYRAGVDQKTVRMAEAGFRPGPRIQFAIAKQFGMKPTDLWPIQVAVHA